MKIASFAGFGEPQAMPPMLKWEATPEGWRALTQEGEVINVTAAHKPNGHGILVSMNGALQETTLPSETPGEVSQYLAHYDRSAILFRQNEFEGACHEIRNAAAIAETSCVRHQRALILLSLGRWDEGFADLTWCEQKSPLFMRPRHKAAVALGIEPWRGQSLRGKSIALISDHGLGDTLMMLRYVPVLMQAAARVVVCGPRELLALAAQLGPTSEALPQADYFCSDLLLLGLLARGPKDIQPMAYLKTHPVLVEAWRQRLGLKTRMRIGVAWSVGQQHAGDYPRWMPLGDLLQFLPDEVEVHSVQLQNEGEADWHGVTPHRFEDLANCAAFMTHMDYIVSVDTCALHLAGAIGHPRIKGLLSKWHSWRWDAPWYHNMDLRVVLP